MALLRILRLGRPLAVLLVVWSAIDLVDHTLGAGLSPKVATAATRVASPVPAGTAADTGADHSFCCSASVHFVARFQLRVAATVAPMHPLFEFSPRTLPLDPPLHIPLAV